MQKKSLTPFYQSHKIYFCMKIKGPSSPSPAQSLFPAVCLYDGLQWDQLYDQLEHLSWWLRVYQCAGGYHHQMDVQQAVEENSNSVKIEA